MIRRSRHRQRLRRGLRRAAKALATLLLCAACATPPRAVPNLDYADLERDLLAVGLLRTETAPADAPYDAADLARNFERIALFFETEQAGAAPAEATGLNRWNTGKTIFWRFDGAPSPELEDEMRRLSVRVQLLTGLNMFRAGPGAAPNLSIGVLDSLGRAELAEQLRRDGVEEELELLMNWTRGQDVLCMALLSYAAPNVIDAAFIFIPAELSPLMLKSCLHEEVIQSLGLPNDDLGARPSIFNDDEEFAYLTRHDEDLLRILYDDRLRPGMTAEEARPVVRRIIRELGLPSASGS
ncbi:MAG: DUF2927 domain-containing protein [Pseudomonadota bacterium]